MDSERNSTTSAPSSKERIDRPQEQSAGEQPKESSDGQGQKPGRATSKNNDGRDAQSQQSNALPDPYSLLNLSSDTATDADIQRAYKRGSRALHPDKLAASLLRTGEISEQVVQETFVVFKNAYEILSDPVLRQAYDTHGHFGVSFVRRTRDREEGHGDQDEMTSRPKTLYQILQRLHQKNECWKAEAFLYEAIQQHRMDHSYRIVPCHATLNIQCSTTQSAYWLNGGDQHLDPTVWPEVTQAHMGLDVSIVPSHVKEAEANQAYHNKWDITLGADTVVAKGVGSTGGKVMAVYEISPGTELTGNMQLGPNSNISVSSARFLSNGTEITVGARCDTNGNDSDSSIFPAFSLEKSSLICSTQRVLSNRQFLGTCDLGMRPNLRTQYAQITCMTLFQNFPRMKFNLNMGMDRFPIRVTVSDNIGRHGGDEHHASLSLGVAQHGLEIKAQSRRPLSNECTLGLSIRHNSFDGLILAFELSRGSFASIKIPIKIAAISKKIPDPTYPFKVAYVSMIAGLLDLAIGDVVHDGLTFLLGESPKDVKKEPVTRRMEEKWLQQNKKQRKAAHRETKLMSAGASKSRQREEALDGLVILSAEYYISYNDDQVASGIFSRTDVREQLQFWIKNSILLVPGGRSKSNLPGFHCLVPPVAELWDTSMFSNLVPWGSLRSWFNLRRKTKDNPKIYVRYKYGSRVYEVTMNDVAELRLPNANALLLGDSKLIH